MKSKLVVVLFVVSILSMFYLEPAFAKPALSTADNEYTLGLANYKKRQYTSAATHFWKSITAGNASPQAWLYLAHSHSAAGNKYEAIKTYRKVSTIFRGTAAESLANTALQKLDPYNRWKEKSPGEVSAESNRTLSHSRLPDRARVFYRTKNDDIIMSVRINGRPLEMDFDTGAPGISLDKSHLRKLGIRLPKGKPDGYSGGAANSIKIPFWNMKASVQVGPIRKDNMWLRVYEKMHTSPLLGQSFYKDFDYTVDHKAKCIEFRRKGASQVATGHGYRMPFVFRKSGNRIVVQIEINGRKGEAMLDTGNTANGISFDSARQMAKFGVKLPANAKLSRSIGVSGGGSQHSFKLQRVRMGPIDKSYVSASCALEISPDDEELPLIGQEVLKGWQYTIDMKKKVIHFLRR